MQTAHKKRKYSLIFTFIFSSANFYLNFPTGKDFGKLSFLQNNSGGRGGELHTAGLLCDTS